MKDSISIHQTEYLLSLPLPEDVPSSSSLLRTTSWSDAAGNAHPQTGWLISLGSAVLRWRAFFQQCVARSSTRAKLYAAHNLVDFLECLLPALRYVWKPGVVSDAKVDSDDLLKLVSSKMPRPTERALLSVIESLQLGVLERSPHTLVLHTLSLRDAFEAASVRLSFVLSEENVADLLTKPMSTSLLLPFFTTLSPHPSYDLSPVPHAIVL
uniref:Uncharacterized protein n=1 Tax=Chromera velia CCMP2878 TaxID=1169474 RepID=A0A0G4HSG6_9ALVE|eukprot:Cvel_8264.t1-p1 / transcript=Cvel_8264.t1 / gene=Cvel_8264 / organism=Chromera_velia_CCMP2878 / gene_product=hypothetical protein / transcript_product=hypothetical protein / location=Cvel_scaffold452:74954-75895(-) / protein_length=210 / sequence_SO=supercontig / SO=protein_coding / is_pseudo=false